MSITQLINNEKLEHLIIGRAKHKVANSNFSVDAVEYGLGATIHYPLLKLIYDFWRDLQDRSELPCPQYLDPLFSGSISGLSISLVDVSKTEPSTYTCTINTSHYSNIAKPAGNLVHPHLSDLLLSTLRVSAVLCRPSLTLVSHSGAAPLAPAQALWLILPLSQPAKPKTNRCTHVVFAELPIISMNRKTKPKLDWPRNRRSPELHREADDIRILKTVLGDIYPPLPSDAARALISRFGSLEELALASPERLAIIGQLNARQIAAIKATTEISLRLVRSSVSHRAICTIPDIFKDYCRAVVGYSDKSMVVAILLDIDGYLITQSTISAGYSDAASVDVPKIIKLATQFDAHAVILLRNRPDSTVTPSRSDLEITHQLESAASKSNITLQDHLIASRTNIVSIKAISSLQPGLAKPPLEVT